MKKQFLLLTMLIGALSIGNAQNIDFTDQNFKNAIVAQTDPRIDTNYDGEISFVEAAATTATHLRLNVISNGDIKNANSIESAKEIEYFTNLIWLRLNDNKLTEIDISKNTALTDLLLYNNYLTEIDVSNNNDINHLNVLGNNISTLNVSNCKITNLIFSENPNLQDVNMLNQPIGRSFSSFSLYDTPNLQFICADAEHIDFINEELNDAGQTGVTVSSDCVDTVDYEFSDLFTLFPNPTTTGDINLSTTNIGLGAGVTLGTSVVLDLTGMVWGFGFHAGTTDAAMSFPWLSTGTYILQVTTSTGEIYTANFVKQ